MPTEEHTYRQNVMEKLDDLKNSIEEVDKKVTYTNGKVRKIIVAIFVLGGFCLGLGFSQPELFKIILSLL